MKGCVILNLFAVSVQDSSASNSFRTFSHLHMPPTLRKENLHLIDKAVPSTLVSPWVLLLPQADPIANNPLFEHRRRGPAQDSVLPDSHERSAQQHSPSMDTVICIAVVSNLNKRIEEDALRTRERVVGMDQAALGAFEMRSTEGVGYTAKS
jgi:hypothetical protein